MHRFSSGYPAAPWAFATPNSLVDCGSKFVCNSTCCTVRPTAPAFGVGVFQASPLLPLPSASSLTVYPGSGGPACGGISYDSACDGYSAANRGPVGRAEVGWLESTNRPRALSDARHRRAWRRRQQAAANTTVDSPTRSRRQRRNAARPASWKPRRHYCDDECANEPWHSADDGEFFEQDDGSLPLTIGCRVRRYRLYARPAFGWCGSFDVHQYQYAITDESIPRCDAIFIVLRDDPRANAKRYGVPYQPLQSGELVVVPGEPTLFRVRLYADDRVY